MAKILLVDDSENTIKLIQSILAKNGHMTVSCPEPRDALEKIQEETFDLLITDITMPGGITGYDFIKTVRAMEKFSQLPVIFVTGRREKRDIEKAIQSGGDDYVVKPIDPEILTSKVESLLKKKGRRQERFTAGAVSAPAEWDLPLEIVQVTEIGMEVQSALPVPVGQKVRMKSPFFGEVGIASPLLRVVNCDLQADINLYRISVHFVGLTEKEMTPLRLWIRSSKVSKRSA